MKAIAPECNTREIEIYFPASICSLKIFAHDKEIQNHLRMAADLNWICQCLLYPRMKLMNMWNWPEKNKCISVENWSWNIVENNIENWKQTISFTPFQFFFFLLDIIYCIMSNKCEVRTVAVFCGAVGGMPSIVRNRWITMLKVLNYIAVMQIMMQTKPNLWILWFMIYSHWSVTI